MAWEIRRESDREKHEGAAKSVGEAVYGELQACTQRVRHYGEGLSQGAIKRTAGFRLFAKMRCADALEFAPEGALCAAT